MSTKPEATIEDLYHVPDNGKAEIVNGELVLMPPTGGVPGRAGGEIYASLREYEWRTGSGYAFPDNVGFIASDPDQPTIYRSGEVAEAEPAVPGWSLPVDDLLPSR